MDIKKIRHLYLTDTPDGLTKKQILNMPDDDLLDMHSFLTENLDEVFGNLPDDPLDPL
jgi:hypothetical protein